MLTNARNPASFIISWFSGVVTDQTEARILSSQLRQTMAVRLKLLACYTLALSAFFYDGAHGIPCRSFATPPLVTNCTMDIFRFRVNTEPIVAGINYSFHCEGDLSYEEVYNSVVREIPRMGFPVQFSLDNEEAMASDNHTAPNKFIATSRRVFTFDDHNKRVVCKQVLPSGTTDRWTFGEPLNKSYTVKISRIGFDEERQMKIVWRVFSNDTELDDSLIHRRREVTNRPHVYTGNTGLRLHDVNETVQLHVSQQDEDFVLECRAQLDWLTHSSINILHTNAHKIVVSYKIASPRVTGPREVSAAGSYTWQCHVTQVEWEVEQQVTVDIFIGNKHVFHFNDVTCNTSLDGRRNMHSCVYTVNYFVPSTWDDFDVICQLRHHPVGAVRTSQRHRVIVKENRMLADRIVYRLTTPRLVHAKKSVVIPTTPGKRP